MAKFHQINKSGRVIYFFNQKPKIHLNNGKLKRITNQSDCQITAKNLLEIFRKS